MLSIKAIINKLISRKNRYEIFLNGFFLSYFIVMGIACSVDFIVGNYIDSKIELFFILLTIIVYLYYKKSQSIDVGKYGLLLMATLPTYALLVTNDFNAYGFHIIVPLGYFLLFSLRASMKLFFIHNAVVLTLYIVGYNFFYKSSYPHHFILISIALSTLFILFFGIFYHLAIEHSYRKLEKLNKRNEFLLKEIHHRVKNNLNIMSSLLGLQQLQEQSNSKIEHIIKSNRLRIDTIAMVHESLYKSRDFEVVDIINYLKDLSAKVLQISGSKDINFHIKGNSLNLPYELVLSLGVIVNELITNSIKYAIKDSGDITIEIRKKLGKIIFFYQDSGKESIDKDEFEENKSLGRELISVMVDELNGDMKIFYKDGLKYFIRIPYEE